MRTMAGSLATVGVGQRDVRVVFAAGPACYLMGGNPGIRWRGAGFGKRQRL